VPPRSGSGYLWHPRAQILSGTPEHLFYFGGARAAPAGDCLAFSIASEGHDVIDGQVARRVRLALVAGAPAALLAIQARSTPALSRCQARVLYRALCRLRLDCRACVVHRLPARLVTTPQTVHSFTRQSSMGSVAGSIRLRCYACWPLIAHPSPRASGEPCLCFHEDH
jgi:hypothetical protein